MAIPTFCNGGYGFSSLTQTILYRQLLASILKSVFQIKSLTKKGLTNLELATNCTRLKLLAVYGKIDLLMYQTQCNYYDLYNQYPHKKQNHLISGWRK